MRRAVACLFLALGVPCLAGAARPYPSPSAEERAEARREFAQDALATYSARSGNVFFLPRKYGFVTNQAPETNRFSHLRQGDALVRFQHGDMTHGIPWSYDRDVPLVLWGPGFIRPGRVSTARASQQDLAPTVATLIGAPWPADARGRVLEEALAPTARKPRVVLTVLFDQGGESLYRLHPGRAPFVARLKREGTSFAKARVSHLDMETAMGHVAVGTGAFPRDHGIPSNDFWHGGAGGERYAFAPVEAGAAGAPAPADPGFVMSPSLGDAWLRATGNRALLLSYCYADRAAIGMGGHGAYYRGNKRPWIFYYDTLSGRLATNTRYYALPEYLAETSPMDAARRLAGEAGRWLGHPVEKPADVVWTPAMARWEGDFLVETVAREAFGADDVPDLLYVTFKSTDASGHIYGQESEETAACLAEQDRQFERLVTRLVEKVGRENLVVAFSADHGGPPLPELSGGSRLFEQRFLADLDARFDKLKDGFPVAQGVSASQLWLDETQLGRSGATLADVKRYLLRYRVDGKPFFEDVLTRHELDRLRANGGRP